MDDRRRDRRAFAGVAAIDILHHLLTPLVLEIHVDIGGFAAFFGHEPRKQQVVFQRIDRGNAQQVADNRIGRRPAPLTQDRRGAAAREPHHVMHRQKIISILLTPDEIELFVQQGEDAFRNAIPVAVQRILPDEMFQPGLRVPPRRHRLVRIFVSQLIEREADATQQAKAFVDRLRRVAKQPAHLGFVLQMALAIGGEATSGRIDRHAFADTRNDVVQGPVVTMGIERVRRGQQRHADRLGQGLQAAEAAAVLAAAGHADPQPDAVGCQPLHRPERRGEAGVAARWRALGLVSGNAAAGAAFRQDDQQQIAMQRDEVAQA